MNLRICFALLAASILSSCGLPDFPRERFFALVWKDSIESSYGFGDYIEAPSDPVRLPIGQMIRDKYICVNPDYFGEIMAWKKIAEEYAKKQNQSEAK